MHQVTRTGPTEFWYLFFSCQNLAGELGDLVLGAATLGLADWKTPRMLIFKCSVKLTAEPLCWDSYPTFAMHSYCHLFTYQCMLVCVILFVFKSRSTDEVLKLFDCFREIKSVNVMKVTIWYDMKWYDIIWYIY